MSASRYERVQVSPVRFRILGVCVVIGEPREQIFRTRPSSAWSSRDDRISDMRERVEEYLVIRVPYVWILDPGSLFAVPSRPSVAK